MIIGFTSNGQVGCSFLNWSFHYLNGDNFYYQARKKNWLPLPNNPLNGLNAHFFKKNHPLTLSDWKETVELFLLNGNDRNFSFYGYVKYQELFEEAIYFSLDKNVKLIYVGTKNYFTYHVLDRNNPQVFSNDLKLQNLKIKEVIRELFFTVPNLESLIGSDGKFRDFLALSIQNLKLMPDLEIIKNFLPHKNFLFIDQQDLLKNEENCMYSMFDFLNLKLDNSRLDGWLKIHKKWKEYILPTYNFYNDLPDILSSIVNGDSFSLKKYKLNILEEAIIQHELMKKYRTRLLVSHLDKFPDDTRYLAEFLLKKIKN
jgi:hypothetical protein